MSLNRIHRPGFAGGRLSAQHVEWEIMLSLAVTAQQKMGAPCSSRTTRPQAHQGNLFSVDIIQAPPRTRGFFGKPKNQ